MRMRLSVVGVDQLFTSILIFRPHEPVRGEATPPPAQGFSQNLSLTGIQTPADQPDKPDTQPGGQCDLRMRGTPGHLCYRGA
jgi:hypothetical protein